ncbi:putative sugar-binding regulatory protein [Escherichia coli]|nr:putative sugar-binding regulatory protein [Escherichia coli]
MHHIYAICHQFDLFQIRGDKQHCHILCGDAAQQLVDIITCEEEQVARIAWFYYHDGLTQSEISDRLGLTRLKVSRLLEKGHQSGIIRVQINSRFEGCLEYETQLRRQFSLQHVRVIPGLADADVGGRLGIGAAHMLMSLLQPQQMLAIGFGEATMNTLQRLSGFISSQQIRLVTLSGGVGSYMTGIGQLNAACSVNIIPAPLRASSADIARTLKMKIASKMFC